MKDILKSLKSFLPRIGSRWPARIIAVSFTTIGIDVIGRLVWRVLFPNAPFTDQHSSACFLIALLSAFGLRLAYEIFHEEDDNPAPPCPTPHLKAEDVAAYDRLREDVLQHFRSAFDRLAEVEQLSNFIDRRIKSWVRRHWVMSLVSGFMIPVALVVSLPLYIPKITADYLATSTAKDEVNKIFHEGLDQVMRDMRRMELEQRATVFGDIDAYNELVGYGVTPTYLLHKFDERETELSAKLSLENPDRWQLLMGYAPYVNPFGSVLPWEYLYPLVKSELSRDLAALSGELGTLAILMGDYDRLAETLVTMMPMARNLYELQDIFIGLNKIVQRNDPTTERFRIGRTSSARVDAWWAAHKADKKFHVTVDDAFASNISALISATSEGSAPEERVNDSWGYYRKLVESQEDLYMVADVMLMLLQESYDGRLVVKDDWDQVFVDRLISVVEKGVKEKVLSPLHLEYVTFAKSQSAFVRALEDRNEDEMIAIFDEWENYDPKFRKFKNGIAHLIKAMLKKANVDPAAFPRLFELLSKIVGEDVPR